MSVISSRWCLAKLIHIAQQSGSTGLNTFFQKMYEQIHQISSCENYNKAKATYRELAAVQTVYKTPADDINGAYQAELAKLLPTATAAASTSSPVPSVTVAAAANTSSPIHSIAAPITSPIQTLTSPSTKQTPQSNRSKKDGPPAQRTSMSSWRRSLDSVRKSYGAMFSEFRPDKGKGTSVLAS